MSPVLPDELLRSLPDKLLRCSDGDVLEWDPAVIEAAIMDLKARPSYYDRFCLPKGGCSKCTMPACPVTN